MIIKVCGMKEGNNIREIEALGIDWMGFIFYAKSPRYVSEIPSYLPIYAQKIGVFVNPTIEDIDARFITYGLNGIQLHGNESPLFCKELKNKYHCIIIKAIQVANQKDVEQAKQYSECCDYIIFDTKCKNYGGSGKTFNHEILQIYHSDQCPFLLSGGIGLDNINDVLSFRHENCIGYDLNSKFELTPGVKDTNKTKIFIETTKQQNHE